MPLGNRAELKRWHSIAWETFNSIGIGNIEQQKEDTTSAKVEKS